MVDFLKSVLVIPEEEYSELFILNPYLKAEYVGDKTGIVDVKLKTVSGRVVHIEIQVDPLLSMRERIVYYGSKLIFEQMKEGYVYKELNQVISIVITSFELIKGSPNYHHRFTLWDRVNNAEFTDIIEVHTLELCKLPNKLDGSRLDLWMRFINANSEEELEVLQNDPIVRNASIKLVYMSQDDTVKAINDAREKEKMDMLAREGDAEERGLERGRIDEKLKMASKMLSEGLSVDTVIKITGLSIEEVNSLASFGKVNKMDMF